MFASFRVPDVAANNTSKKAKKVGGEPPKASSARLPESGRYHTPIACNLCRARKLKCSGGKDRCARCESTGSTCVYSQSARGGGSGKKRARQGPPFPTQTQEDAAVQPQTPEQSEQSPRCHRRQSHHVVSTPAADHQQDDTLSSIDDMVTFSLPMSPEPEHSNTALSQWDQNVSTELDLSSSAGLLAGLHDSELYEFDVSAMTCGDSSTESAAHSVLTSPLSYSPRTGGGTLDFQDLMNDLAAASATSDLSRPATTRPQGVCKCLGSMVQLLEDMGLQRACAEATGIDGFLMCLRSATYACSDVLACNQCRLCSENSMLLATVVQQMGDICCDMGDLLAQEKVASSRRHSVSGSSSSNNSSYNVSGSSHPSKDGSMLEGAIWFGRYSVETPKMRDSLVHNLIVLHLGDLRALLARLKNEIWKKRGAWKLVAEAEEKAERVYYLVQDQGPVY
ncbi:hypothetical protein B0T17DRAFT_521563 [Bombardia bombarda]|uniref:Zn(2)-C6 fungal-type domain-containing protein n=1 Tax=Bombardia bombarda TaxID=252184 RepID=A0AA40CH68_9PEZI|nr:hypothetical protein B0T17DRAFT_521563 [Bombardia bombarda]